MLSYKASFFSGKLLPVYIAICASCVPTTTGSYYSVGYKISTRSTQTESDPETLKLPPSAAIELLAEVKTVAFAPPDTCLESGIGNDIATQRCGEVMTALEQAASESGLQVVSWQSLRGNEPALNYARRSSVDILFELNRLGPDNSSDTISRNGTLGFYEVNKANVHALPVTKATQDRCANKLLEKFAINATQNGVILDVKMVSVRTGMVLWNYRHRFHSTISMLNKEDIEGIRYFVNEGEPDQILCTKDTGSDVPPNANSISEPKSRWDAKTPDTKTPDAKSPQGTFEHLIPGKPSSSSALRQAAQVAASEFVELLVYMQALNSNTKRVTLHAPSRPKEAQAQPSAGCATVAAWIKSGLLKSAPSEYSQNCPKK